MKKYTFIFCFIAAVLSLTCVSCDDSDELSNMEQVISAPVISAYESVISGPKDTIQTSEAIFETAADIYKFSLIGIYSNNDEDLITSQELFSIDEKSGQISIISTKNKNASELSLGTYIFSVGMDYLGGVVAFDSIASIEIIDLPFGVEYATNNFDLSFGLIGEFATVTVNSEDETLEVLQYELTSAPDGITIDPITGTLSKETKNVATGSHSLSLRVRTNKGIKTFSGLVNIQVGEQPQLFYTNSDTQFASVSISSWSGFTTAVGGKTEDLGTGLTYSLKESDINGLTINESTGDITLVEDSNIAEGSYNVSITVVDDGGFEVDYDQIFSVLVTNSWEQVALDELDVSAYADKEVRAVNDQFSFYETTKLNASAVEFVSYKHAPDAGTGFVAKGFAFNLGKNLEMDAPLLREVAMDGTFRKVKVSFGETSVGKIQSDNILRRFYFGYNRTELIDNSNFVDAEWNLLIAGDSEKWAVNNYKTDFKTIETEFVVDDPAQTKLYLQWRMTTNIPATGFVRACFDAVKIDVMKITAPVFE